MNAVRPVSWCPYANSFLMLCQCTRFVYRCVTLTAVPCQEITAKLLQTWLQVEVEEIVLVATKTKDLQKK